MTLRRQSVIPGFGLSMGYTIIYLSLIVLIPLSTLFVGSAELGLGGFWETVSRPRVVEALKLSFGMSLLAAGLNLVAGLLIAWVLVRYDFPGRKLIDALVDLPFALPTAVAGIALAVVYAPTSWLGQYLAMIGIQIAYQPAGILVALLFIGLPFIVRTVQPVLEDFSPEIEEAATSLGAKRWTTFRRVILPELWPALLTGFALAFARGVGEYGSVIFIAGNIPLVSEIAPLVIVTQLQQFQYDQAAAIALAMLLLSFAILLAINGVQWWMGRARQAPV